MKNNLCNDTTSFVRPIKIGPLELSSNIAYSPLAGCSDLPFRQMGNLFRPGLFFCEMVKMDALVRNDPGTYRLLDYTKEMHPIGAQICGSHPKMAKESAKIIEDLGFDLIDLNCGCPVDKVTKDKSGSGLLKTPTLIGEILNEMVSSVSIPVTLKIRTGWDEENIVAPLVTQIGEAAGASAIFVHGRTRSQAYRGLANRNHIKECVEARKQIPVFGNGDIFCPESAKDMFIKTNCDGILIGRGTLGSPWIFKEVAEALQQNKSFPKSGSFYKEMLLQHFYFVKAYQHEKKAIVDMRRVGCWYLKGTSVSKTLRELLNRAKSLDEIEELIHAHKWDEMTFDDSIEAEETSPQECC